MEAGRVSVPAYCPTCGEGRVSDKRFCAGCSYDFNRDVQASAAVVPLTATHPTFKPESTKGVDCPNGSHPNFVRSVSSVYHEGYSTTMMSGQTSGYTYDGDSFGHTAGYASLSGTSQTALSRRLTPPTEPVYDNPYGSGTKWFFGLCIGFCWAYLVPVAAMWWVNRGKSKEAAARHAYVDRNHPLWVATMERWNSAYYCSKCDGVFVPNQSQFIPAGQASQTIFAL
jgi:hypothetical protein